MIDSEVNMKPRFLLDGFNQMTKMVLEVKNISFGLPGGYFVSIIVAIFLLLILGFWLVDDI